MAASDRVLEQFTKIECLELLGSQCFGRLGVVVDGRPMIFPVNYALDGDTVVFRTDVGTKFDRAVLGPVAFEVDSVDPVARTGWSVVVQGMGQEITWKLDERSERLRELDVHPWVPGERVRWVEILAQTITGRRVRPRQPFEAA
jgi:uncharacterized protein